MQLPPNATHYLAEDLDEISDVEFLAECGVDLERELTERFVIRLIRQKLRQLIDRFGCMRSDRRDLEQQLIQGLLERHRLFNPFVATWEAFATMIVDFQIATILEERSAAKREYRFHLTSLSEMVPDSDGELVDLATQISEKHLERVTGVERPADQRNVDLAHDVGVVLSKLPPDLRDLAEQLKTMSVAELSRKSGVPRSTLRDRICKLREYFKADGFGEFFEDSPPSSI